jgi:hypothetical protein
MSGMGTKAEFMVTGSPVTLKGASDVTGNPTATTIRRVFPSSERTAEGQKSTRSS